MTKKDDNRDDKFLDCALPTATGLCRDEYPYNTTYEGGKENYYKGGASLRCVSKDESKLQRGFISWFYRKNGLTDGKSFIVVPIGPFNGWFDRSGMWHTHPMKK